MDETISTQLNSKTDINCNAENFYKNYWKSGEKIKSERDELSNSILKKFFPNDISKNKVLEIGIGGEGGIVNTLKSTNEVYGVDISDSAINLCKKLNLDVIKANLDSDIIPFMDNYFDIIFAFEVFEHFANPQHAIEEIYRLLKEKGTLLISTPNRLTYHWPRLFYPTLFEQNEFENFLRINNFEVKLDSQSFYINRYRETNIKDSLKKWNNYFYCKKIGKNDSGAYFKNGLHFWNQKDNNGLRLFPIEAIDCFRKSLALNNNIFVRCFFTRALTYRAVYNDIDEFNNNMGILVNLAESQNDINTNFVKFSILMAELELKKFNLTVLSNKKFDEYLLLILNSGETNLINEIKEELNLVNKLFS